MMSSRFVAISLVHLLCLAGVLPGQDSAANTASAVLSVALPTLSGELPAVVSASSTPYLVTADIIVPPGKTVTIEAGTMLLFQSFTGLQVHGTLRALGTEEAPIFFTSEHDPKAGSVSGGKPAPYDWNGITVTENAVGTLFEHCRIGYSLFGINSLTEYITLKNCLFRRNGRSDVVINGVKKEVASGVPYSYEPLGKPPTAAMVAATALTAAAPSSAVPSVKIALRTTSVIVALAGCAVGLWKFANYRASDAAFWQINNVSNIHNLRNPSIVTDWEKALRKRNADMVGTLSGFCAAILGIAGFTLTLGR